MFEALSGNGRIEMLQCSIRAILIAPILTGLNDIALLDYGLSTLIANRALSAPLRFLTLSHMRRVVKHADPPEQWSLPASEKEK